MESYKILVTGGAGYIGAVLVPELLKQGYEVTVVDNFMFRQNGLVDCCYYDSFSVIRGDCRDERLMAEVVKDKDIIIPLAGFVGAPQCSRDITGTTTTNVDASHLLVRLSSVSQRIIYPATNSAYGIGKKGKVCTEKTKLRPVSLYAQTKVASEKIFLDRGNCISFRFATVFGMSPRMRVDLLVNDFVYRAVSDSAVVLFEGHFKRNYLHIRDVAGVIGHGIENFEKMKNESYNVGLDDANLSKVELCQAIQRHIPGFVFFEAAVGEDPDERDYMVSNSKIQSTNFTPAYSLDFGIKELIKGYTILRNSIYSNV